MWVVIVTNFLADYTFDCVWFTLTLLRILADKGKKLKKVMVANLRYVKWHRRTIKIVADSAFHRLFGSLKLTKLSGCEAT